MSVRITTGLVRIEGVLDEAAVPALLSEVLALEGSLRLDLDGLRSADTAGVRALRELIAEGAAVQGASLYIAQLIGIDEVKEPPGTEKEVE